MSVVRKALVPSFLIVASLLVLFSVIPDVQAVEPSTYALNFDGTDDYVRFPYKSNYQVSSFSVSVWVYPIFKIGVTQTIAVMSDNSQGFLHTWNIEIPSEVFDNTLSIEICDGDGNPIWLDSGYSMPNATWKFVAVTYNATSTTASFFVDGVSVNSSSIQAPSQDTMGNIYLGTEYWEVFAEGQNYFSGTLDEFCYYNRVLTASEIDANYNSGNGRYEPYSTSGLVLWAKMDEGTGTTTKDRTSNKNTGTLTGASWASGIAPDWYSIDVYFIQPNYVGTLSAVSAATDTVTFTVSGASGQTSSTKLYVGEKGNPVNVIGATSYTYDSTNQILTISKTHASDAVITVNWFIASSGDYTVRVFVSVNYLPVAGASIIINGENKTTDLFGQTSWSLPFGDYVVWAYCQGMNQSQAVSINQDRVLGFNFTTTPEYPPPPNLTPLLIIALVFVIGFILLSVRRRK